MVMLQRKIRFKYTAGDDYKPEEIGRDKHYPVIGYEIRKSVKTFEGKERNVEDIFYVVLNDKSRPVVIASWNGETIIDQAAEGNFDSLLEQVKKVIMIFGVINERLAKITALESDQGGGR